MTFQQIRQTAPRFRTIPLESVLRACQAQPDRHDQRKWHTAQGVLSVTGARFINWTRGGAGGGAIDLVMHLQNCRFKEAVQWLGGHFAPPSALSGPIASSPQQLGGDFIPPSPDPGKLGRVRRYLTARRIAPALIDSLVASGSLYADRRANAAFLLLDPHRNPVGAELRGTTPRPWRGLAPGSRKDRGFFRAGAPGFQATILCESAIDALSCFALHPDCRCISTSGARSNPRWLPALIERGHPVFCGFDADPTGEQMARAMMDLHPSVQRLRPSLLDWNDVLTSGNPLSS
jgi:hypothetical protein